MIFLSEYRAPNDSAFYLSLFSKVFNLILYRFSLRSVSSSSKKGSSRLDTLWNRIPLFLKNPSFIFTLIYLEYWGRFSYTVVGIPSIRERRALKLPTGPPPTMTTSPILSFFLLVMFILIEYIDMMGRVSSSNQF